MEDVGSSFLASDSWHWYFILFVWRAALSLHNDYYIHPTVMVSLFHILTCMDFMFWKRNLKLYFRMDNSATLTVTLFANGESKWDCCCCLTSVAVVFWFRGLVLETVQLSVSSWLELGYWNLKHCSTTKALQSRI